MNNRPASTLDVVNLTVTYPGKPPVTAVTGFDLGVAAGEVVGVLGPSGSGKSSILSAIAGIVPVAAGYIRIDDVDVTDAPTHTRGVGVVFQDGQLFPHRSVGRNVAFGLEMAGWDRPDAAARVADLLTMVGLADFAERDVRTLSGGEAQRVALARSLAPRPKVLLLDEPLSSLDAELRVRLGDDVARILRAESVTALLVTHDPDEAARVCDRHVRVPHS